MSQIEIISAGAGSGKTHRLTGLLTEAIASGQVRPEGIVATTFTNRAAAELKERVRMRLFAAHQPIAAQRVAAARMGTVNSVAGRLVSEFAFELGLSPELSVIDQQQAQLELKRSLSLAVLPSEREELDALGRRLENWDWKEPVRCLIEQARTNGISPEELVSHADRSSAGLIRLLGTPLNDTADWQRRLVLALELFLTASKKSGDETKGTQKHRQLVAKLLPVLTRGECLRWSDYLRLCNSAPTKKSASSWEPALVIAREHLCHPQLAQELRRSISLVFGIASRALATYADHKRKHGFIDFADQETLALHLLQRGDARERLRGELDLVLVDEFQDTSPMQLALFLELSSLAKRSVWVGDKKQSIFGFRGADPQLMDAAVDHVLGARLPETLSRSYRSRPELVRLTSALFVPAFGAHGVPPELVALEPAKDDEPPGLGRCVERWLLPSRPAGDKLSALASGVQVLLQSGSQVRDRATGTARPARPGDLAILCRSNDCCADVAHELALLGLRADIGGPGLLKTPEGALALAGLGLWIDPRDTLARATLARFTTHAEDLDGLVVAALEARAARANDPGKCMAADNPRLEALLVAREQRPLAGPLEALEAVLESFDLVTLARAWGNEETRLANLDALRATAVSFVESSAESGAVPSPAGLLASLHRLAATQTDLRPSATGPSAVAVRTWHSVKGLEWPVVILFELDSGLRVDPLRVTVEPAPGGLDAAAPLANRTLRYWLSPYHPQQSKGAFFDAVADTNEWRSALTAAERQELRLLYVGWTRARDYLVLAGPEGVFEEGILSLLHNQGHPLLNEPDPNAKEAAVNWAGVTATVRVRNLEPAAPIVVVPQSVTAPVAPGPRSHPPAYVAPSSLEVESAGEVLSSVALGEAIAVPAGTEMDLLGSAIHGLLAVDMAGLDHKSRLELANGLLNRWEVADALSAEALLHVTERFNEWLAQQFSSAIARREWPVTHRLATGTLLRGVCDLALETSEGWVVVDHKSFPGNREAAIQRAASHHAQLNSYGQALVFATGRPVCGLWVHLPLAGLVVQIGLGDAVDGLRRMGKLNKTKG